MFHWREKVKDISNQMLYFRHEKSSLINVFVYSKMWNIQRRTVANTPWTNLEFLLENHSMIKCLQLKKIKMSMRTCSMISSELTINISLLVCKSSSIFALSMFASSTLANGVLFFFKRRRVFVAVCSPRFLFLVLLALFCKTKSYFNWLYAQIRV